MFKQKDNILLFGSIGLILLGIILASVVNRVTTNSSQSDIRAQAGVIKYLTANATVVSSDSTKGTLTVTDLYFTDQSRSGQAKNLGSWMVTTPATFNFSTISPGSSIVIGIVSSSFKVATHALTAATITPQK